MQVFAIGQTRQKRPPRVFAQVQPRGESVRIVGIRAQLGGAHVEQMLHARLPIGDAAPEAVRHADQVDFGARRGVAGEFGGERAAAEAGADRW